MPEAPILVPPTPTITQGDSPEQIQKVGESVQAIFDKIAPERKSILTKQVQPSSAAPEPEKEPETPTTKVETPAEAPKSEAKETDTAGGDLKVPSFIEKALSSEPVKPETPAATGAEEIWPEEPPTSKTEDGKQRWKAFRESYEKLKGEVKSLKERPTGVDPEVQQKLEFLENQNKEYETVMARTGVEQHREFQQKILVPMQGAWNEAARIVHEAGGDPNDLAKALSLSGKSQYEALDQIFEGMPESAKIEANEAIRSYKRLDIQRRQALADAPRTAQELKKADLQRQYSEISKQKEEMKGMFDSAIQELREKAKVEVLQKSNDPDAIWWNEQADKIVETSRNIFLENTDMKKVAYACALAPMVDVYRKLWLTTRSELAKSNKVIQDRFGSEPNMSESGGNTRNGTTPEEDLKKPFKDVFLREFHKAREKGMR